MRLWTLHPRYLDRQGLLAVWREGLLAQCVLKRWMADPEKPTGYRNHPQLDRFKATVAPEIAISLYLAEILAESQRRSYRFNGSKIDVHQEQIVIPVTTGQIEYERKHLINKLLTRDRQAAHRLQSELKPMLHPMFNALPGDVESWEIV